VSRARNNHFDLDRERFELGSLLREVCERFSEQARQAGSQLTLEDCPQVEVHWDRLRVEQALTNLVTNAIKYGAGGPISVRPGFTAAGCRSTWRTGASAWPGKTTSASSTRSSGPPRATAWRAWGSACTSSGK